MAEEHKLIWAPGTEPVAQASLWVPTRLYKWQCDILQDMTKPGARVAVVTPNESGKTSVVIPVAGLSFMAAFPGGQVVSTSGVERQIREQLWPGLRAALSKFPAWQITEELKIKAPPVRGLPPSTWEAFTAKDPHYAEGFHSRVYKDDEGKICYAPLLMIIDEAKTFDDDSMFDAFKRCDPDLWLVISTPGEDKGPFFSCFGVRRGKPWKCHEISWTDCPHLRVGRKLRDRLAEIEEKGEHHPFVQSWIFGKFFRAGGRLVFERMDDVSHAMGGMVRWIRGERRGALDFSAGGDEAVAGIRDGNHTIVVEAYHERDTTVLGDKFMALMRKHEVKPENVIGDNGGLGLPIIDYMERRGFAGIYRYMADAKPRDETRFVNRIAEDHFQLRFWLEQKAVSIVADEKLKDQMRRRMYLMKNDDSNRIRLEPKEKMRDRGEGSPDRLDMLTMLYSDFAPAEGPAGSRKRVGYCPDPAECFRKNDDEEETWHGKTYFG